MSENENEGLAKKTVEYIKNTKLERIIIIALIVIGFVIYINSGG